MAKYDLKPGDYDVQHARVAIVAARFNAHIVDRLCEAANATLEEHGIARNDISLVRCPGAFEIPLLAKRLAGSGDYDAIITLGAVVRGGTPHFEYVAGECARGVTEATLATERPVIFGVLTTDDDAQALARAGGAQGNKGYEAALAALEMISLLRKLESE